MDMITVALLGVLAVNGFVIVLAVAHALSESGTRSSR
jgi:hypothetical protein